MDHFPWNSEMEQEAARAHIEAVLLAMGAPGPRPPGSTPAQPAPVAPVMPVTPRPPTATRMGVEYCLGCNLVLLYCGCRSVPADAPTPDEERAARSLSQRVKDCQP